MSTAMRQPRFITPPELEPDPPAWRTIRPELDRSEAAADRRILAGFRARLHQWDRLTPAQRHRTMRDIGIAVLAHCGGQSHRDIAALMAMSPSQVGAAIKSFANDNGFITEQADQSSAGGEAAGGGPQGHRGPDRGEDAGH